MIGGSVDALATRTLYCASEVREDKAKPDCKSDIYSVGVILFEMLHRLVQNLAEKNNYKLARQESVS